MNPSNDVFAGVDERDIKECRNSKCSLSGRPLWAPNRDRCLCTSRLKPLSWRGRKAGLEPYVLDAAPAKAEPLLLSGYKAVHFYDWPGTSYNSYEKYLLDSGVVGYMTYSIWSQLPHDKYPTGFAPTWEGYCKWLTSIGIAPRTVKQLPAGTQGETVSKPRIVPINAYSGARPASYSPITPADTFTCSTPDVKDCPLITKEAKPAIEMPGEMFRKWLYCARAFTTEWIAYLIGHQREDGDWIIEDMYFPKQKATGAHVDVIETSEGGDPVRDGTVGSVHSHVDMGAFFSTEDEKHFNHPIELVINRKGDIASSIRLQLECGRHTRVTAREITLTGSEEQERTVDILRAKLTEQQPANVVTGSSEALCSCSCNECKTGRHGCPNAGCRKAKMCWCACDRCDAGTHGCKFIACRITTPTTSPTPTTALPN